ncbi:MAG: hypothetical protein ACNA8O_08245 [Cyanobacteriota bacterium]
MTFSFTSAPSTRLIKPACFALCAVFLIFASRGLLSGYSYWLDEIYSVSASLDTWQELYQRWILRDVHPPLYQILLKLWMLLLGSSETATRLLSFIFSLVTLSAFSFDAIAGKRWRRVTALLFIGASPFFAYYAQETRSYSLVLALSSIVTLSILQLRSKPKELDLHARNIAGIAYYLGAFLLSITHYFGWIYVFVISAINFFERRIRHARLRALVLVAAISVWPIWHVVIGDLGGKSGGDFWIKISPPVIGTINTFLNGCLPFLAFKGSPYLFLSAWALIAALILVSARSWNAIALFFANGYRELGAIADETRFTILSITLVVGLLSLVDLHTPMSTTRNYIVLLPAVMISLANSLTMMINLRGGKGPSGVASFLLALLIVLFLAKSSWSGLAQKIQAHQNWKNLSEYVKESKVCSDGCFVIGSYGLHDFYFTGSGSFDDLSISKGAMGTSASRATLDEQVAYIGSRQNAKILGFHGASGKVADLMGAAKDRVCIQPPQTWENSTFLILPRSGLTGSEEKYGMRKCVMPE